MEQTDFYFTKLFGMAILCVLILSGIGMMIRGYYQVEDIYKNCELKKGYITKIYRDSTSEGEP